MDPKNFLHVNYQFKNIKHSDIREKFWEKKNVNSYGNMINLFQYQAYIFKKYALLKINSLGQSLQQKGNIVIISIHGKSLTITTDQRILRVKVPGQNLVIEKEITRVIKKLVLIKLN